MGCRMCLVKYILCLFNFVMFLAGGAIMGVGIWILADRNSFLDFTAVVDKASSLPQNMFRRLDAISYCDYPQSLKLMMAYKRRNMFYENKKRETTEFS